MPIGFIGHVNIRCEDLEASRRFYVEVLGLRDGERPPLASTGAWLYGGDNPIIDLRDRKEEGSRAPPRRRLPEGDVDLRVTGSFDHVGLNATGLPAMRKRLEKLGIPFRDAVFPDYDLHQVFLRDPDGVKIELNYSASE